MRINCLNIEEKKGLGNNGYVLRRRPYTPYTFTAPGLSTFKRKSFAGAFPNQCNIVNKVDEMKLPVFLISHKRTTTKSFAPTIN